MNRSDRQREIDVTSYAEIVLATPASDLAHPAFGKLFVETIVPVRLRRAALPAAARRLRPGGGLGRSRPEPGGTASRRARIRDRSPPIPGPRPRHRQSPGARRTLALRAPSARRSIPSSACGRRVRLAPGGFVRLSFATGIASSQETAVALARKYCEPNASARTFALAATQGQSTIRPPRHLDRRRARLRATRLTCALPGRLAARGRRGAGAQHARPGGPVGARHFRRPAHPAGPGR